MGATSPILRFINRWPLWLKRGVSAALVISLVVGGYLYVHNQQYKLTSAEQKLLALPSVDLKMVKETKDGFTYNHAAEQKVDGHSITTAAAPADSTGKFPYEVTLPHNQADGIKFSDSTGDLSFTMKPNFSTAAGREDKGRVVYPEGLNSVHAYTFKRNGVKEDIILSKKPSSDTYTKSWTLDLGDKLEAKLLPNGGVGIYSADSMLFGNVQASDPKDQALVDKARKNGQKTNLAFVIPAPYVTDTQNPLRKQFDGVKFSLNKNVLTLTVQDMRSRSYPLSIDPTLVVTTTSDFQQGTDDDGMIDYTTSGQIGRSDISYGAASSMVQQTSAFTTARYQHSSIFYKGYLYIIGGTDGGSGPYNDIQYCPVNADGSVGTCTQQTNAFSTARYSHTSVVYNGFLYIIGGHASVSNSACNASGYCNDIQYCPLNSNGSVGTCVQQLNAFTGARYGHTSVVYNDYIYIIGGVNGGGRQNDIQYCPLNSDGSVGSCTQQAAAFTGARYYHTSVAYNGYLYIIGGNSGSVSNDIQYCPLNANGSVGTCTQQTSAFTTQRWQHTSVVSNGYLYIIGGVAAANATGCDSNGFCNDIQYCPLNTNGSVSTCTQQLNAFTGNRGNHSSVIYSGYFYIIGGNNPSTGYKNDILYGLLGKLGAAQISTQQTGAFTTARYGHGSVVYNGYIYILGGLTDTGTYLSDIQYCPLNSNGSVGTCVTNATGFTTARNSFGVAVSNGYLYIAGGFASPGGVQNDIQYCPLNSNGSVGTCTQQTNAFTTARQVLRSIAYGGYLYIVGGYNGSYLNDIQYCPFNNNGSVGTCTQQTNAFTTGRYSFGIAAYNGYLYISGGQAAANATGCNASGYCNDVINCPLNSDGSVGTCTQQTSAFTNPRYGLTTVTYNGFLYIVGGYSGNYENDVQFCSINSNGSVGTCTRQQSEFISGRRSHTTVVSNGYIYIAGGNTSSSQNDIQYFPVIGGAFGSLGSSTQQTNAFTTARYEHASVIYNGYLYIIGGAASNGATGCDATGNCSDIIHCPINANGSVGTCVQQTNAFTTARYGIAAAVHEGYLYLVGGSTFNSGFTYYNDIQYCPILSNGNINTCTQQTNAFTSARTRAASFVYNNFLYIVGGYDGSYYNDIQHCPINSNFSVGACTQQTSAFTTGRDYVQAATYNGYLYIIGGYSSLAFNTYLNDIQYCTMNSNGSVGACTQQTGLFIAEGIGMSATVNNGFIYILGGLNNNTSTYFNDLQACALNSNGSVNICNMQKGAFTTARELFTSVAYDGYLYIVGGANGGYLNDIQYLSINSARQTNASSFTQQNSMIGSARQNHAAVVYNGYLYISGGRNNSGTSYFDIQYCPINSDGSVGACNSTSQMSSARWGHTSVAYNGYLYIIGGNANPDQNDIEHCPINANGTVGTCVQQTNAFTGARDSHTSVVYNGYLYIIGGGSGANDIQYCPFNSNGTVGTCTRQTSAFPVPRYGHSSFVYNGYLYIVGGYDGSSIALNDVVYCPLNSNGSVGTCTQEGAVFSGERSNFGAVAYNGYLYIIEGYGAGFYSDIQTCPLNNNGSVGTCTQKTGVATDGGRHYFAAAIYNNYVYVIGGFGTVLNNDIQRMQLPPTSYIGHYERVMDVGTVSSNLASLVYNGTIKCGATLSYRAADGSGVFGGSTTITNTQPGTSYTLNVTNSRYLWVSITLDDSICGGYSNVTDMTLTYLSNPSAPTLNIPASGATNTSLTPNFQMRSSDPNNDYIRYKIDVCSNSDCSTILRTIDQTSSQTGWSGQDAQAGTAYIGSSTIASSTMANHTYQAPALSAGTQYWWRAYAIDPGGDNVWSQASSIQSFTTNYAPAAPTLAKPSDGAISQSFLPVFQLRTTDAESDYLRYKIDVCSTSNCSSIVRTIDETSSQTGWSGQDTQTSTAYVGNSAIGASTMATHTYQAAALSPGQYWWRAYAIDPGGSNTWSSASSIQTFTTNVAPAAPSLIFPANSATGVSASSASFQLRTTDADSDYLRYKIQICSDSSCNTVAQTFDETSSQINWSGQDAQSGTAFNGSSLLSSSTIAAYSFQQPTLKPNTQYWWRAYAIDPAGTNTFGSASSINTFTTASSETFLKGGINFGGGSRFGP